MTWALIFPLTKMRSVSYPRRIHLEPKWKVGKSLRILYRQSAGVDPEDGYQMWYKDELSAEGSPQVNVLPQRIIQRRPDII